MKPFIFKATSACALLVLAACDSRSPNFNDPGAPTAVADSASASASPVTVNVLSNDTHSQGGSLLLQSFVSPSAQGGTVSRDDGGTANDTSDDQLVYTPPSSFTGTDTFTYTVADQNGATSSATVTITGATVGADKYSYEGTLVSTVDGVTIEFTVFVPSPADFQARASECTSTTSPDGYGCVPLLIHSHGFGGAKHADFSQPGTFLDAQIAKRMWEAGYFVITYSQRGFGSSTGSIEFMSPHKEGEDFRDVLNWAINHIRSDYNFDSATDVQYTGSACDTDPTPPASCTGAWGDTLLMADNKNRVDPAATNGDEDPSVGTIGYSYGGGFQFNAQRVDNRLDAIMPMGTWHDLRYSLSSNDNPKSAWITLLTGFAVQGGSGVIPPFLVTAAAQSQGVNMHPGDQPHNKAQQVSSDVGNTLGPNGPVSYCEYDNEGFDREIASNNASGASPINADLFMIQGYGDTLFNFNEGFENAYCWEKAGKTPYLLLQTSGHPLPLAGPAHYAGSDTGMYLDEVVHCGYDTSTTPPTPFRIQMVETGFAWFEWKLRQPAGAEAAFVGKWDVNGTAGAANHKHACVTQENTDTTDFLQDDFFNGTTTNATAYRYSKEGLMFDGATDIIDPSVYTDIDVPASSQVATGVPNEQFIVLHTELTGKTILAGIPLVQLNLTRNIPGVDRIIFAGIGVRRAGTTTIDLLHYQTASVRPFETAMPAVLIAEYPVDDPRTTDNIHNYPIRFGDHPQDNAWGRLIGVTARLNIGDEVGLVLNGYHEMYATNSGTPGDFITVSGPGATGLPLPTTPNIKVKLPLHSIGIDAPCQQNDPSAANACPP